MSEEAVAEEVVTDSPTEPIVAVTESDDWKSALPEDIRDNPNFSKYSSMESFAKGHLNAVSMLGKEPELSIPENDDDRAEFYNKLGRPESSDGYQFKEFDVPEPLKEYIDGRVQSYKELAHNIGLSAEQASNLHEWYLDGNLESSKTMEQNRAQVQQEGFDNLGKEWGEAYDKNVNVSKLALAEFADDGFVKYLEDTGLGDNPSMVKAFFNIGVGMIGEQKLEASASAVATPAAIDDEVSKIMALPGYWDENSVERPGLVAQVNKLLERKHPEPQT